ncbi:MAG: methylenetetrahydrofolate reductase [Acidobacteria bacterium]|nr:methylenetetrahydrofolate reductase [Acidobacteriota bacterium]
MLATAGPWVEMIELNPPRLPDTSHRELEGKWTDVLITDNVFGQVRVSPYAYAARITHDIPAVRPTVVVSTRDRNILAIESEVRGAIGNGVRSMFVVVGDTLPEVDHWANHYEIVQHLRRLQDDLPTFEVGMPTRLQEWTFRKRIDAGAQFFIAGPMLDPATIEPSVARLNLRDDDPPVFLGIVPPFSPRWAKRMVGVGAVEGSDEFRARLSAVPKEKRRPHAWLLAREAADRARDAGCRGVVLMGLKFETVVGEAYTEWNNEV